MLLLTVLAGLATASASDVCHRDVRAEALLPENRISYSNHGGLLNGGVCWWHSRFQRAALYLAEFEPCATKPSREEAFAIARRLARTNQLVRVPGYANLNEFTSDWADVVQKRLELWQKIDGIVRFQWINGLVGHTHEATGKLAAKLADLYNEVEGKGRVVWQKLQVPGIPAHAWLVVGVEKAEGRYRLKVIDSNRPEKTLDIDYAWGDDRLFLPYGWSFVPYTGFEEDLERIDRALKDRCG